MLRWCGGSNMLWFVCSSGVSKTSKMLSEMKEFERWSLILEGYMDALVKDVPSLGGNHLVDNLLNRILCAVVTSNKGSSRILYMNNIDFFCQESGSHFFFLQLFEMMFWTKVFKFIQEWRTSEPCRLGIHTLNYLPSGTALRWFLRFLLFWQPQTFQNKIDFSR